MGLFPTRPERQRLFASTHSAFEAIDAWEARVFGSSAGISRYVGSNAWLVRPRYLARLYLYPLGLTRPRIPGLHRTNVYGLLRSHLQQRARTPLASHAEALQIGKSGQRLRLFYLGGAGRQLAVKSLPAAGTAAEAAQREVELRQRLQTLRSVALPRIESVMEERGRLYIAEELILGRRFSVYLDRRAFQRQLLPQLAATYRALEVEQRPLGDFLAPDLAEQVEAVLAPLTNAGDFRNRLAATVAANPLVAAGMGHGDLLPSNLAISGGRIYLLDWGQARVMPLAFDLLRLAAKYPRIGYLTAAVRHLAEVDFPGKACGFADLLTVFLAERMARDPGEAARHLARWHHMLR